VILFRAVAARELADSVRYYDELYPGRGQRFAQAVEGTLALIVEFPMAFTVLYDPDIRSAKVARFPYRIVFLIIDSNIEVVAIAHAKRRPQYWRGRAG
jgi:toxin ParE1/3/4